MTREKMWEEFETGLLDVVGRWKKRLEQEPILDRDCEHCSKTYGTLGCCTTVSNKWVYSCKEGQREYLLDKIRAEIKERKKNSGGEPNRDIAFNVCLQIIDKYKAESEKE